MMDAWFCDRCKSVEETSWRYSHCPTCDVSGGMKWLRTDEQKKDALISVFQDFFESARRVMKLVSIAFPERRAMQQHEDGTMTEVEVSLDLDGIEGVFESLLTELKTLTRKVGE